MDFSNLIYGYSQEVPTSEGQQRYINFDNAASTPPFKRVIDKILMEANWYSGVHRGKGYKSQYSTTKYESARQIIANFVNADLANDVVIFTKNTTDAINKVSHYLDVLPGEIVIFTHMEHHSNELPWLKCKWIAIDIQDGGLNFEQLEAVLHQHQGNIKLLAVCGASNVNGYTPPIHLLAEMAHKVGARILVDGAQLVPHRPVQMYPATDIRHLDFLVFSGHKMYAPFGSGVLIGPKKFFQAKPPSQLGGGTIKGINLGTYIWADPPEAEEAGSPNVLGALAIAEAAQTLTELSWDKIITHENKVFQYARHELEKIPNIILYNPNSERRVGVISFNLAGFDHNTVAEFLAMKGIGVRNGCFCARNYVQNLLKINPHELRQYQFQNEKKPGHIGPGMVRISFGCYNQVSEVDVLVAALLELVEKS